MIRRLLSLAGIAVAMAPAQSFAVQVNLATLSCARYQDELLAEKLPGYVADPIDTVMWLFGFSVARSKERVMYGDSLTAFGFALDAVCRNNPSMSLLDAVTTVKSKRENPMDLTRLDCATFDSRHSALRKSDSESADTLGMWLFGYSVAMAGGQVLDAAAVHQFDAALQDWCAKHPGDSLYDALNAPNPAIPAARPQRPNKITPVPRH